MQRNAKLPQNVWEAGKAGNGRSREKESMKPVPAQHKSLCSWDAVGMGWETAPPLGFTVTDTHFRRLILAGEGNGTTGVPSGLAEGTGNSTRGPQTGNETAQIQPLLCSH